MVNPLCVLIHLILTIPEYGWYSYSYFKDEKLRHKEVPNICFYSQNTSDTKCVEVFPYQPIPQLAGHQQQFISDPTD